MTLDLDTLDRKILAELTRNARLPIAELARRVGLSKTPVALRIRHLEEIGLITGYRAILSPVKLGLTHVTYVEVSMNDTREPALQRFNAAIRAIPEVEECYMIAGGFDYLIKARVGDMDAYRAFLGDVLVRMPGVRETRTYAVLEEVKSTTVLPL